MIMLYVYMYISVFYDNSNYSSAGSAVVAAVLEAELEIPVTSAYEYVPY